MVNPFGGPDSKDEVEFLDEEEAARQLTIDDDLAPLLKKQGIDFSDVPRVPMPTMTDYKGDIVVQGTDIGRYSTSICASCKHLRIMLSSHGCCAAFPEGVPESIGSGQFDQRNPYPGDKGIRYEMKPGFEHVLAEFDREQSEKADLRD